jgi:hypothetical protein
MAARMILGFFSGMRAPPRSRIVTRPVISGWQTLSSRQIFPYDSLWTEMPRPPKAGAFSFRPPQLSASSFVAYGGQSSGTLPVEVLPKVPCPYVLTEPADQQVLVFWHCCIRSWKRLGTLLLAAARQAATKWKLITRRQSREARTSIEKCRVVRSFFGPNAGQRRPRGGSSAIVGFDATLANNARNNGPSVDSDPQIRSRQPHLFTSWN